MAFKIKDGLRIGTVDVFNNAGALLVSAGTATKATNLVGGNGTTLLGSLPYQSGVDTTSLLSPNTSSSIKVLTQTGDGTNGAAPVWTASTGTGSVVFASSPTLTTPTLGVASATTINKVTLTTPATGSTLTIADGKTLTASNTLTFTGTDSSSVAFGAGGTVLYNGGALGTPSSATLTNATGLPVSSGISGLGTGVATFLATPTSANLASAVTDETGSGVLVFATAPTFTTSIDGGATFAAFASSTALTLGYSGTASSTHNIGTGATASGNTKTVNIGTGAATGGIANVNIGAALGTVTVNNDLTVTGNLTVNGTTTTVNSTTVTVDDINIELGSIASPTDSTANGGGITLKGTTDKTITYDNTNTQWTSNQDWNIASGKAFKINNTSVLNATTLGSGVTGSSLTSVGTIGTGVWQGTAIGAAYGGTGLSSYTIGDILYASTTTALSKLSAGTSGYILTSGGAGVAPSWTAPASVNASNLSGTTLNATIVNSSLTSVGTITSGTWNGSVIGAAYGGTGVANNAASTLTISGSFGTTLTVSGTTALTLPTSGTLATLAGTETFTNKSFNSAINYQASATTIANDNVIQATVATTSATTVDSWAKATYRSAKYLIQVTQGSNYQVSEIMVIQDGTNTYMTEFAVIETNGALATFTSSISGSNAILTATMGSATSATINIQRTLLVV